ncbi:MAG TPA: hypothetical protein VGE13_02220 [Candidatus Saccharimonadales bacterium]
MSEKDVFSSLNESYFQELDDIYLEPHVAAVFSQMRIYNELLASEYVDSARINEIMNELDREWSALMMQHAVATGFFYFPTIESVSTQEVVVEREYHENQDVQFNGVIPTMLDQSWDENGQPVHKYELRIQLIKEAIIPNEESSYRPLTGSARVDDIISLEFPNMMSPERARHWLEHYHADEIEEIDTQLLNPSDEECEMVCRLTNMKVDCGEAHQDDEMFAIRSSQALDIYTNSLFSFDKDMPYDAVMHGDGWTVYEDGETAPSEISEPTRAPIKINRVAWVSSQNNERVLEAHLDVHILTDDKDGLGYHILLPLTTVKSLHSLRYAYFGGYNKE